MVSEREKRYLFRMEKLGGRLGIWGLKVYGKGAIPDGLIARRYFITPFLIDSDKCFFDDSFCQRKFFLQSKTRSWKRELVSGLKAGSVIVYQGYTRYLSLRIDNLYHNLQCINIIIPLDVKFIVGRQSLFLK